MPNAKQQPPRRRPVKNTFTTKSGTTIKLHHSIGDRIRERRDAKARRRAAYLSRMPKERWKRILFRLKPRELARYWFSRDGAIMALKLTGIGIVLCFILIVGMFAYFRKNLPNLKDISGVNLGGCVTYYDRTNTTVLFQDCDSDKRIPVAGDQISKYMGEATVAVEDRGFYTEGAFNVRGILRAAFHDIFGGGGGGLQGGSTITQQLVKLNENWTAQRTFTHKVEELILAVDISREYSKSEILTGYMNIAPYENNGYGVQVAAQDYFGVDASRLTLAQAAMLAAIPQDPPYYSPYSSPTYNPAVSTNNFASKALITRQHYVLDQMVKSGYITQDEADAAKQVDILSQIHPMQSKYSGIKYPYYVLDAKQQLEGKYGATVVRRGGWKVTTALDVNLQNMADADAQANRTNLTKYGGQEEAMVGEDVKTGQIVMLVGGVDFYNKQYGQINYAATLTSPGSSFKPMDYLSLIENNTDVGAGSVLYDSQGPLPGYPCTDTTQPTTSSTGGNCLWDYDYHYPGAESLRYALAGSRNVPAIKAMLSAVPPTKAGSMKLDDYIPAINKTIQTADAMMAVPNAYQCYSDPELTKTTQCFDSAAIGDGAYLRLDQEVNYDSSLARLGAAIPTTFILKITDASNNVLYKWTPPKATQVVRQDSAYIIDDMLSDPNASYLSAQKKFQHYKGWNIAVKTGTEFYNHHGLMTAWSTQYAVVSWVGTYNDQTSLANKHMEDLTWPLTAKWIEQALDSRNMKPVNWSDNKPSDLKVLPSFIQRNHVGDQSIESGPNDSGTDLFPAWYVQKSGSTAQTYDLVSGGLATSCTPKLAQQSQGGSNTSTFSADIFYNASGSSANPSAGNSSSPDTVHVCGEAQPSVHITASACTDPNDCDFTVAVTQGAHPLSGGSYTTAPAGTIALLVNGNVVQTQSIPTDSVSSNSWTYTFSGVNVPDGQNVQAQVVDSVLYQSQTGSLTAPISAGSQSSN